MKVDKLGIIREKVRIGDVWHPQFELGPIEFEVEQGYVVGVIGRNGSGKSTLFDVMLGVSGEEKSCISDRKRQAYILEKNPFPKIYTAKDIEKNFSIFYEGFDKEKYYAVCKKHNIPVNKPLEKLSRGMAMLVQVAFAFSYKSDVLILDEATAHMDSFARNDLYEMVCEYVEQGGLVFWATHIVEELDRMADYVLGLKAGKQIFFEEKEKLVEGYKRVKGSARQLDCMKSALLGRVDHETYSEGILDETKPYPGLDVVMEQAKLSDIIEYLL